MPKTLVDDRVRREAFAWRVYAAVRWQWPDLPVRMWLFGEPQLELEFTLPDRGGCEQRFRIVVEPVALDGHPAYVDQVVGELSPYVPGEYCVPSYREFSPRARQP